MRGSQIHIIYTSAQWTALGNAAQVVPPNNIDAYTGNNQRARYLYEVSKEIFEAYKRYKDTSVQIVIHIFRNDVFLNLQCFTVCVI